jgi:hypothetical protein
MRRRPSRAREPVQVYLDGQDRDLLESLVERSGQSRAELLRLGLRRLSEEMLTERRAESGLGALRGVLDSASDVPNDLAERHDDYLYGDARPDSSRRD